MTNNTSSFEARAFVFWRDNTGLHGAIASRVNDHGEWFVPRDNRWKRPIKVCPLREGEALQARLDQLWSEYMQQKAQLETAFWKRADSLINA